MALFCYRALPLPSFSDRHAGLAPHLHPRCHRALPALCRDRHPVRSGLADLPFHREAEESRPPAGFGVAGDRAHRRPSRRARLCLCHDPGQYRQEGAGDLLLLAHGHFARLHRRQRQAADREELPGRRHRAAGRSHPGDPRRRPSRARRPDRPRHHHDGRHHAAGGRQQGRPCRDHGCGAVPDSKSRISSTAPSRSCSRPTRRSAAASTRST